MLASPAAPLIAKVLVAVLAADAVKPIADGTTVATSTSSTEEPPRFLRPQPIPTAAAIVPGLLLHGSGHFARGERKTAYRLLAMEGIGLAAFVGGSAILGFTGASRRIIEPTVWTMAGGAALFTTSWLADLYGVLAPPSGTGRPLRVLPVVEARLGTRYLRDPTLVGSGFLGPAADLRWGGWRLSPGAWFAVDGSNHSRYEAFAAYRLVGPRPTGALPPPGDGSFIELVGGAFHHRYREGFGAPLSAAFQLTSFELRMDGRLDLARIAPTLYGAFAELGAGLGLGAYHYPGPSTTEANQVLLARFAFGILVGHRADRWGEVRVFYDHRHDDFPGGFKVSGLGSGVLGHFGIDGRGFFSEHWGVRAEVAAGSAFLAGFSLVYRYGKVLL